jgi:hypothetical protein
VKILILLPLLAAIILSIYPLVLRTLLSLPLDEYAQAARAPAWFTVIIGGTQAVLALWALGALPSGDQVFIGRLDIGPLLMADAYTLWGSVVLGTVLAVGAWVPAARRSVPAPSLFPFPFFLLLAWLAQIMLFSIHFPLTLVSWLLLLAGVAVTWWVLYRPRRQWREFEMPLVLVFVALVGTAGMLWLNRLAHGDVLPTAYSFLLSASPQATNATVLLLVLAWLGPAVYLPWWLWARRDEPSMIWLPAALSLCVAAQFTLVHMLYLAFPPASRDIILHTRITPLFLIDRTLSWMTAWGLLALLIGSGWLAYHLVLRVPVTVNRLRPLALVCGGILLLGISIGLQGQRHGGVTGLFWLQLTWVGMVCTWLAAGGMLSVLAPIEQAERATVQVACWLAVIMLMAFPPGPGFRGLVALWEPMRMLSLPRTLVAFTLVVTGLCAGMALPRWFAQQHVPSPRPGAAWGIGGPFLLAFLLLTLGLFGGQLTPLLDSIHHSLLQTMDFLPK